MLLCAQFGKDSFTSFARTEEWVNPLRYWQHLRPKRAKRSPIVNLQAVGNLVLESRAEILFKLEGHAHPFRLGQRSAVRLRKALKLSRGM
jgi:hypothetical protein